jgi:tol-pal system protein YbgF
MFLGEAEHGERRHVHPMTTLREKPPSRRPVVLLALTLAFAGLLSACWYPKERGQRLEQRLERVEDVSPAGRADGGADLAALREQVARMDAAIAAVKSEQAAQVDAAVAELKARLEKLDGAVQAGGERSPKQRELAEEVGRLRAMVERFAQRLDAIEKDVAQARRRGGERVAGPPPAVVREEPSKPATPGRPGAEPDPLALAREQERRGQKTVAREIYEQYVTEFPAAPAAAEAHFRLGELAFADRRYRDAITHHGKVARDFPRSDKVPDALLRTGESMLKLDLKDEAVAVLSQIPERYPGTPAAARASKHLAELPKGSASASGKRE